MTTAAPPSADISAAFHLLRARRRRDAIAVLADLEATEPIAVRALARDITAREEGVSVEQATGEPYRNVYTALTQTHLRRLHDANVVEYDADRKVVTPGPNLAALAVICAVVSPAATLLLQHDLSTGMDQHSHQLHSSVSDPSSIHE